MMRLPETPLPGQHDDDSSWEFRAPIELRSMGAELKYTVVYLPPSLAHALPKDAGANVRVYAVVNEVDVEAAFQSAHGRWSLMVSKALQRRIGACVGDVLDVRFSLAPADAVDVPDDLRRGLALNDNAAATFAGLSAGKKRALSHRVQSAKLADTRRRRVDEVVDALAGGPASAAAFFGRKMAPAKAPTKKTKKTKTTSPATPTKAKTPTARKTVKKKGTAATRSA